MNAGTIVALAIVIAVIAFAIRATFFKKDHGCCGGAGTPGKQDAGAHGDVSPGCSSCAGCKGCASQANCLQPVIKDL